MTFTLQTDSVSYKHKPAHKDIAAIKPRIANSAAVSITLDELERRILSGITYTPGVLSSGSKAENWKCQQIFCIDIDNEDKTAPKGEKRQSANPLDVEEVLKRCEGWDILPALIYETFSSKPEWLKFRIVFVGSEVITDGEKRDRIQLGLQEIFPECDSSCKNRDRLFFGGKNTLYKNEKAVYNFDNIAKIGNALNGINKTPLSVNKSDPRELDRLKAEFDFLGYIRATSGNAGKKAGRLIQFNPCPVCGHNDDFYYYPETNSFKCFGAHGNVGGSIIDYLMHTRNMDKKTAIEHFKYDLCGCVTAQDKSVNRLDNFVGEVALDAPVGDPTGHLQQGNSFPYIYENVNERTGEVKYIVSCPLLANYIRQNSHYIFVRDKAVDYVRCYWYEKGCYKLISDNELKGIIKKHITDFDTTLLKMRDVDEVFRNLTTDRRFVNEDELNADENVINFRNGLLYLDTLELKPHTPEIYSTIQIPCNWNPEQSAEKGAPVFTDFLNTFTGGDEEKQKFLLQYMGVCLSNISGYRMKKSLFMVGEGNTGKSQLKALTERLLGYGSSAAIDLSELEQRFGTSKIYGKRLSGSSDMSYVSVNELKVFKQITGGDNIFAEFKGKPAFEFVYKGLLWYCTNKLPKFGGDRGDWVYDRIITLRCDNVIPPEKQDKSLLDKMYAEREAIVYMAVMGAKEVLENGLRFDIPQDCLAEGKQYKKENSPVALFYEECCEMRKSDEIKDSCTTKKMYDVFRAWCMDNNSGYALTNQAFKKELSEMLNVDIKSLVKRTKTNTFYTFTLTTQAKRDYVKIYGYDTAV